MKIDELKDVLDYTNQHIEHFSANAPINELPVDEQVIIEDFLMHYNVYECNSEQEAEKIAHWHLKKYYNYIPEKLEVKKISERAYSIDIIEEVLV